MHEKARNLNLKLKFKAKEVKFLNKKILLHEENQNVNFSVYRISPERDNR